jgi:Phage-related protein
MRSFFSTRRASLENPSTPINGETLGALFQRTSAAGVAVDEYSIIGLPAFYRAVQILGGVIAALPFDIIEKLDNGGVRIATDHANYKIVSREPCELYTSHTFYKTMVLHYLSHGAFYAVINRNNLTARINSIHILNPTKMEISYNTRNELIFKSAETKKHTREKILFIFQILPGMVLRLC